MRTRYGSILILAARLASGAPADFVGNEAPVALPAPLAASLARIDPAALAGHIAWLAAPEREGRGLGTRGLDATADYLADRLKVLGVPPLGRQADRRSTYFQRVPLREITGAGGTLTLRRPGAAPLRFAAWESAVLPQIAPQRVTGAVVYAGWGIQEATLGHDDFRGLDVRGKIVLFQAGVPPGREWRTPELLDRYANPRPRDRYDARLELLRKLGAKAAIALEDDLAAELRAGSEPRESYFLAESGEPESGEPPLVRISGTVHSIPGLELSELSPKFSATIEVTGTVNATSSRNVIGVLEGSDPVLRSLAVVIGAHMDHLGLSGGALHPGADDNASGVAALLEIARAFAGNAVQPRRSVVFILWTGEEAGQLGSTYYVRHAAWPLARTAAYVNLDMIAHPWSAEEIARLIASQGGGRADALMTQASPANFAEPGVAKGAPELLAALATAARGTGMVIHLDRVDGLDGGSDYRAFARRGVPWIRFFGNFFPGYHQPDDTPDRLDPAQVQRMTQLAFATTWLLAN